jgi:hypothetical protein
LRYPALAAWRRELAAGQRTPTAFDWLWSAACAEAAAAELEGLVPEVAASLRREAEQIVRDAEYEARGRSA